jgi:hypothetical protein
MSHRRTSIETASLWNLSAAENSERYAGARPDRIRINGGFCCCCGWSSHAQHSFQHKHRILKNHFAAGSCRRLKPAEIRGRCACLHRPRSRVLNFSVGNKHKNYGTCRTDDSGYCGYVAASSNSPKNKTSSGCRLRLERKRVE